MNNSISLLEKTLSFVVVPDTIQTLSDERTNNFKKVAYSSFLKKVKIKLSDLESISTNYKAILSQFKKSLSSRISSSDFPNYVKNHSISFDNGQALDSKVEIVEYEYDFSSNQFKAKQKIFSDKLSFRRYDPVDVFVSTGLFYSDVSLNSFGITQDSSKIQMTENSNKKAVTALFLNFSFFNSSDFLRPIIQLGIDPTKKNPYLLVGAGFVIPSSKFAITGGPIWTWNQELKTLKVGDVVNSNLDLENDIESNFESAPKGWYLGLQYNF